MGRYLNSSTSYVLYKGQTEQPYFVDKSQMLSELFPFLDSGNTHICITRPRRFGKTVMANMITAFLGKKQDSDSIFKSLKISQNDLYSKYRNQYNVISIDFSKMPRDCDSYTDYIDRIETNLIRDLRKEYPQIEIYEDDSAADVLETIFEECDQQRFVFVLDEWDFIFHKDFVTEENKKQFYIPEGFSHGFLVLSDTAEFCYKCTDFYHPDDEGGIAYNTPDIGVKWPIPEGMELTLSEKDTKWGTLEQYVKEKENEGK